MALDKLKYTYQDPARVSQLNVDNVLNVNTANVTTVNSKAQIISPDSTNVGLTLISPALAISDLQQFRNSSNTITSGINAAGQMYFGTTPQGGGTAYPFAGAVALSSTVAVFTYVGASQFAIVGQQIIVAGTTPSYFNGTWTVTSVSGGANNWIITVFGSGFTAGGIVIGPGSIKPSAQLSITTLSPLTHSIVIKGISGQLGSAIDVVNPSDARVASIGSSGSAYFAGSVTTGALLPAYMQDTSLTGPQISFLGNSLSTYNVSGILIRALGPNQKALIVRASSTTATITAATANGTTITYTNNNSQFFYPGMTVTITGVVSTGNSGATAGAGFNLTNATVASANLSTFTVTNSLVDTYTSGGLATPTSFADLQQWQDRNSSTIAYVTGTGGAVFTGNSILSGGLLVQGNYGGATTMAIANNQNIIGLTITANSTQTANLQEWRNNGGTPLATLSAAGAFSAVTKSFDINHPTKENMRLRYGSLEGPENGVYIRGITESNIIQLPDYWTGLVHKESITVSLTPFESPQNIYVKKIENNNIYIGGEFKKAFFTIYGERKDIDRLTVEY
jgi:hypothetical protein